ncbi:endonuclease NucS domain-containing protein [Phormidium nigroviride]
MPDRIRLWEISKDQLNEITQSKLDLESRLETWLDNDISILADDLLVIGRQVITDHGGKLDLLCMDRNGDLAILELKKDKTAREVTAQALDYASWVKDLSNERVTEIANSYLLVKNGSNLENAFFDRFSSELPDLLNAEHNIIIVAAQMDSSSERIIKYLSETYGVRINVATFQYFRDSDGRELLARKFLMDVEIKSVDTSKRNPNLTQKQLTEIADSQELGEIYRLLYNGLIPTKVFWWGTTQKGLALKGVKNNQLMLNLLLTESTPNDGLKFKIYTDRLSDYLKIDVETLITLLPNYKQLWQADWSGSVAEGFFKTEEQVNQFVAKLNEVRSALK